MCGIPDAFHVDHGSDFTSAHLEQVMADLKIRAYFSLPGQPRGRGKVERIFGTINQMCLPSLPGYAPRGTPDRAGQARLTLAGLDQAIGTFIREVYNLTPHGETGLPPQQRWEAGAFIPRMPTRSSSSTCCCSPWPSRARSTRTGSTSRGCATWTRCWPPTSATP